MTWKTNLFRILRHLLGKCTDTLHERMQNRCNRSPKEAFGVVYGIRGGPLNERVGLSLCKMFNKFVLSNSRNVCFKITLKLAT